MWEWPVTAEWRGVPHRHNTRLSLSAPSAFPHVSPFFPSLVISPGAGIGTARGEVPMRLKLPACLPPFSLFFLLEVEHHQGVRFSAINCCLIPKRQSVHTFTLDHTWECVLTKICHTYADMEVITLTFWALDSQAWMCTNTSNRTFALCVCLSFHELLKWSYCVCTWEIVFVFIDKLVLTVNENDSRTW